MMYPNNDVMVLLELKKACIKMNKYHGWLLMGVGYLLRLVFIFISCVYGIM